MEETATQPVSQLQGGVPHCGQYSISDQDKTDVICILHPASPAAYRAVELVVKQCPQHILQNEGLEYLLNHDKDGLDSAFSTRPDLGSQGSQGDMEITDRPKVENQPPKSSATDIAIRISSRIHNPCLGFTFGRNPLKCDIPIVSNDETIISNSHFRIYVKPNGVLMAEDTSTNSTWVDDVQLRAKPSDPKRDCRRSIVQGSVISLPYTKKESIRFLVAYPARHGHELAYGEALDEYIAHMEQLERQAALIAPAAANGNMMPPPVRIQNSVI